MLCCLVQVILSGTVMIDGRKYLDRHNYIMLTDAIIPTKLKESKYCYLLIIDNSHDSLRYLNLFNEVSINVMDELRQIDFYIINVSTYPEALKHLKELKIDVPMLRFYSYGNIVPYTDYFWNKFRMAKYLRQRVKNKVKFIESAEEINFFIAQEETFLYLHDNSILDDENRNLRNLHSMACLYKDLQVGVVRDKKLFEYTKKLAHFTNDLNIKNKSHFMVYHSSHRGIKTKAIGEQQYSFKKMRHFYSKNRFSHVLDYNKDLHDFLFIENCSAIFLVVKEMHVNYRTKNNIDWGKLYNKNLYND